VPLLAGWNSQESAAAALLGRGVEPTAEGYGKAVRADATLGPHAGEILKAYGGSTPEEVTASATALASDRFIAFSTWKWIDLHARTGGTPTYRYFYSRPRPAMNPAKGTQGPARGASHSAEIEYAMGNLAGNDVYAWTPEDRKVSETMFGYFVNFVKTGDPNGNGLPAWPALEKTGTGRVMHIDVTTQAEPDTTRDRYLVLDKIYAMPAMSSAGR
jgi:para-nitrobenzyl esterase